VSELTEQGQDIAQRLCAACHGIGRAERSPIPVAPAFRRMEPRVDLDQMAERLQTGIIVGHPEMRDGLRYNAASLLRDGRVELTYHKQRLPNSEVFDEERYFAAGREPGVFTLGETAIGLAI
ncbi:MAG: hypothetical protein ACK4GK_18625, partial [Ferrovibrio sp.]